MSRNGLRYLHLAGWVWSHAWAIHRPMLPVLCGILAERMAGHPSDPAIVAAAVAKRRELPAPTRGDIALIPMHGVLAPRMNLLTESSGGTSYEALTHATLAADADPATDTIVVDVDSPGGSVAGATEFATVLREVRTRKLIIAVANPQMASGAYWTMSIATKVYASPSALVGSIGVYSAHTDFSEAFKQQGITRRYIYAGQYKTEGNEAE